MTNRGQHRGVKVNTDNRAYRVDDIEAQCGHSFDRIVWDTSLTSAENWADEYYTTHPCDDCLGFVTKLLNIISDFMGG